MTKKKSANKGTKKQKLSAKRKAMKVVAGLDNPSQYYAALLDDPCNGPLVRPVYSSGSAGYLVRQKQIGVLGNNYSTVDGLFQINPGGDANDTTIAAQFSHAYSDTAGGSLGSVVATQGFPFLTSATVGSYRAVAGCLKLHYIGSELDRKGVVTLGILPDPMFSVGDTLGSAAYYATQGVKTVRLGSEPHEIRWAPMVPADQAWASANNPGGSGQFTLGTSLYAIVQGIPAGSVRYEVDFVYEWMPEINAGMPASVDAPPSRNTLNEVLTYLGNRFGGLTKWAVHKAGVVVGNYIQGTIGAAMNVAAPALLTM